MKTLTEQAQEIKLKGSPLTIEQLITFLENKEAKASKKAKKSAKSWKRREEAKSFNIPTPTRTELNSIGENNFKNAMENAPSWMRK